MCHFLPVYHLGIVFLGRVEGQNITLEPHHQIGEVPVLYFDLRPGPKILLTHQIVYCHIQDTHGVEVLPLCRGAIGVFYSPSRLGYVIRPFYCYEYNNKDAVNKDAVNSPNIPSYNNSRFIDLFINCEIIIISISTFCYMYIKFCAGELPWGYKRVRVV